MVIRPCKPGDLDDRPLSQQRVCLYTRDGKRLLGRHPDEASAAKQERAIMWRRYNPGIILNEPTEPDACIQVMSLIEADLLFKQGRYDDVHALISLGDPGSGQPWFVEAAAEQGVEALRLEFLDTKHPGKPGAPDSEDMEIISDFLDEILPTLEDRCLVIHCELGVRRSAAVAVMAWEKLGLSRQEAKEAVLRQRPIAMPNRLMLELT